MRLRTLPTELVASRYQSSTRCRSGARQTSAIRSRPTRCAQFCLQTARKTRANARTATAYDSRDVTMRLRKVRTDPLRT